MTKYPALFLDRDGVINIDKGYVHNKENCEFINGIFDLVKRANQHSYKVVVVTNQAGIARGFYTEEQFLGFSEWMKNEFSNHQAFIDKIYFCPHHPVYGQGIYHVSCNCRKPAPGMFQQAQEEFDIDMSKSIMVGNNLSDIEAACAVDVKHRYLFIESKEKHILESDQAQEDPLLFRAITSLDQVNFLSA
ncbi:D-glycero-alpha-D-manno-heptose-1, 7-bisphosphate 7-phosphatase [Candidatus Methylobacter favarea]|uniref:D,D-heptose 1,7-bisphosphate phosphatase n=1 Tax=Candidatus Methylobacter favarea TaxID=2707345 RepID=A0A8S0YAT1_9GAMM|nr:D-glycero-beta-D-manno-heptose 1,7-bisphosphate 7-phosphatase [Candidatus Methylobacter favarea]CAA9892537.1 D-glycero-alpha-D-manno-heptose-1, 7-bisphosphate 7-phosphatase [Candidatus Methylobacter favarea]